jgi:hypothetical protein
MSAVGVLAAMRPGSAATKFASTIHHRLAQTDTGKVGNGPSTSRVVARSVAERRVKKRVEGF